MAAIRLTWDSTNDNAEGRRIYRADAPMDPEALPTPIADIPHDRFVYHDDTVVEGNTYYYRVSDYVGATERLSAEIVVFAGAPVQTYAFYWALDDGPSPYADTGTAGQNRDMSAIGTVTDDAGFSGISLAGSGAVAVADTSDWIDSIIAGSGKKFRIGCRFKFSSLAADSFPLAKFTGSPNERQFLVVVRTNGDLDFIWYGALNAASFRQVKVTPGITTGTEYALEIQYDGTISTNNGLDRVKFFLDGVEVTGAVLASSAGSLHNIVLGPARLAVGAAVSSSGTLQTTGACSGQFADAFIESMS